MKTLFNRSIEPLSKRLRPTRIEEFVGQDELFGENGILREVIKKRKIPNIILTGPSGCGKSSFGEVLSNELDCEFYTLNATTGNLSELREIVERGKENLKLYNKKTILFLDEIHRFNKGQQDALLSYIEDGIIILVGATTENPYYSLNNALLSRVLVFEFKKLEDRDIEKILNKGEKLLNILLPESVKTIIVEISNGDSRIALNYLELYSDIYEQYDESQIVEIFRKRKTNFHRESDRYNLISAMIKSMRGSDPDSAIYWLARLLEGGEDPRYIARRIVVHASEDIGMANPEAMLIANSTLQASEKIGMPEIRIILAQAVIYLSISTKSNSVYNAINSALEDVKNRKLDDVPLHISHNAVGYKYPHNYKDGFVREKYMEHWKKYYFPKDNKNERMIQEKLDRLWKGEPNR